MTLPELPDESESRRELRLELPTVVSDHVEAATLFRPIQRKGGEHEMASEGDGPLSQIHVRSSVLGVGEEVKDRPVVPHVESAQAIDGGDVRVDPTDARNTGVRPMLP